MITIRQLKKTDLKFWVDGTEKYTMRLIQQWFYFLAFFCGFDGAAGSSLYQSSLQLEIVYKTIFSFIDEN